MELIYYSVAIGGGKSGRQTMTIVSYDDDGRCCVEEEKSFGYYCNRGVKP